MENKEQLLPTDQRDAEREKQDLQVESDNQARKSWFVKDEYFDDSDFIDTRPIRQPSKDFLSAIDDLAKKLKEMK